MINNKNVILTEFAIWIVSDRSSYEPSTSRCKLYHSITRNRNPERDENILRKVTLAEAVTITNMQSHEGTDLLEIRNQKLSNRNS